VENLQKEIETLKKVADSKKVDFKPPVIYVNRDPLDQGNYLLQTYSVHRYQT